MHILITYKNFINLRLLNGSVFFFTTLQSYIEYISVFMQNAQKNQESKCCIGTIVFILCIFFLR